MPVCLEVPRGKRQQESLQVVLAVEKKASFCKLSRRTLHEGSDTERQMNNEINDGNSC